MIRWQSAERELLKLEVRRLGRRLVRQTAIFGGIAVVMALLGGGLSPFALPFAFFAPVLSLPVLSALFLHADRSDGSLAFLCGLPVRGEALAGARIAAIAVLAAPFALATPAVAFALFPTMYRDPFVLVLLAPLMLFVPVAIGAAMLAAGMRLSLEVLLGIPFLILFGAPMVADRVIAPLSNWLYDYVPSFVLANPVVLLQLVAVATLILCIATFWVGWRFAATGFTNFRPAPATPD